MSAVVDEKIFCAHGGIPRSATNLETIRKLPFELSDPQHQSDVAWEILWSDPCHQSKFNDLADFGPNEDEDIEQGYIYNAKRGTAYLFGETAMSNFLAENQLEFCIRAHEVPQLGYSYHFGTKCATIFRYTPTWTLFFVF